jgi:membrane protein
MGAALAYYTVFSIAPLLLIVISVAGLIFGEDAARGAILGQLQGLMGVQGAQAVETMLASVKQPADNIIATLVGVVVLLIGATTVFGELQDALDRIWRAPARVRNSGLWKLLRTRLLSFGMILGIGFLLMVSLVLSAALSALGRWWSPLFGGWEILAQGVNFIVGFGLVTTVFAMIYKIMPRVHVRWRDVWLGAAVTALLFSIGKLAIGLYIGKSGVASGYGAAGSVVVLLVWVYYSAQIFLMGAEFTWVYANTFGSRRRLADAHATLAARAGDAAADAIPARATAPERRLTAAEPHAVRRAVPPRSIEAAGGAVLAGVALQVLSMLLSRRRRKPRFMGRLGH